MSPLSWKLLYYCDSITTPRNWNEQDRWSRGEGGRGEGGWYGVFRKHEYLVQGAILSTLSHKSAHLPPTPGEIFRRP